LLVVAKAIKGSMILFRGQEEIGDARMFVLTVLNTQVQVLVVVKAKGSMILFRGQEKIADARMFVLTVSSLSCLFLRVRENLCTTLTRKFIDEMKAYQNSQQNYKNDIKKKVTRQVQIVKPDATAEEVDAVMRSEGGRDALYKERILAGGVNDQIKYVLYLVSW
jgi:hypothetical protein